MTHEFSAHSNRPWECRLCGQSREQHAVEAERRAALRANQRHGLRSEAARVINQYTGWGVRWTQVAAIEDPVVDDVIAVDVTRRDGHHQFIYNRNEGWESVEEVEFKSWPPRTYR
jgi:hypothetical protein